MSRLNLVIAVALASVLLSANATEAYAQGPDRCISDLTDAELGARLDWVERDLRRGVKRSRWWYFGWLSAFTALGTGELILGLTTDVDSRDDKAARDGYYFASAGAFFTAASMAAMPMTSAFAWKRLRKMPNGTRAEREARLVEGLRLLKKSAERQAFASGPLQHLSAVAYSSAAGIYLAVRYDNAFRTALAWLGIFTVKELQTLSVPKAQIHAWDDERYGSRPCMAPLLRPERGVEVSVAPSPGGLGLRLRF